MINYVTHIGTDESGKGDFFGPLVIAGVMVDEKAAEIFIEAGIKDSKKITDKKILKLEPIIKQHSIYSVVAISNEKYNQTMLVITHDENIALQADRILSLEDGRIVKDEVIRR